MRRQRLLLELENVQVPVCCILGSHLWMIPCLLWPALRWQEDIFLPPPDSDL